jgi:hypothetical protein
MNNKLVKFNLLYEQIKALLTENIDGFQSVEEFTAAVYAKASKEEIANDEELKHKIKCTDSKIAKQAIDEILLKATEGDNADLNTRAAFLREIINRNE